MKPTIIFTLRYLATIFYIFKIIFYHFRVEGLACHVGKSEDRERLIEETVKQLGGIDILVSNAGTNPAMGAMLDVSLCGLFGLIIVTFWLDLPRLLNLTIILMIRSYNWNYGPFWGQHNQFFTFFTSKTFCYKTHIFPRLGTSYTNSSNVAVIRESLSCIVISQLLVLSHQIFIAIVTLSSLTNWYLSNNISTKQVHQGDLTGFFVHDISVHGRSVGEDIRRQREVFFPSDKIGRSSPSKTRRRISRFRRFHRRISTDAGTILRVIFSPLLSQNATFYRYTVKPVLTATSEQRPPVNNDRPDSPALIIILRLYQVFWTNLWTTATLWTTVTFSGSQGWPLYTGLTVLTIPNS